MKYRTVSINKRENIGLKDVYSPLLANKDRGTTERLYMDERKTLEEQTFLTLRAHIQQIDSGRSFYSCWKFNFFNWI